MNIVKYKFMLYGMEVLLFILFLTGTFFDLNIAEAVYAPKNAFALMLTFAEMYIIFGAFVLFDGVLCSQLMNSDSDKTKKIVYCIICVYLTISTSTIGAVSILHEECMGMILPDVKVPFRSNFLVGALVFYPLFFIGYRLNGKRYDKMTVKRIISLLIFITAAAFMPMILKSFAARPRYRYTLMGYDGVVFCPWYAPLENAEEYMLRYGLSSNSFKSFPSGHSLDAAINVCVFPAISLVISKLKGKETLLLIIGFVLALLVMLSRMLLGAHYLSDVSFGGLIGMIMCIIYFNAVCKSDGRIFR